MSAAAALLGAAVLCACGGGRPDPERPGRTSEEASTSPDPAKGQGVVTFRYSNKSTDANLQVDLGATDISLEMTGRPAEAAREAAAPAAKPGAHKGGPPAPSDPAPEAEAAAPTDQTRPERKAGRKPKAQAPGPDTEAAEEELGAADEAVPQDVTDKVLLGIRKAQEFFYQKRYPEALQMVRSSLDARPTAEGHALAGSIHYMMGATGLARRHWQQALRLNPDMPAVVNMLERIATPGGRGSPHPRPLAARRNTAAPSPSVLEAAAPLSEPPFPDEVAEPVAPPLPTARPSPAAPSGPAQDSPPQAAPKPSAVPAAPAAPASSAGPAPASADEVAAAPPAAAAPTPAASATEAAAPAAKAAPPAPAADAPAPSAPGPASPRAATGTGPGGKPRFPQKAPARPASGRAPADADKDKSP